MSKNNKWTPIENALKSKYNFRYNKVKEFTEFKLIEESTWNEINDYNLNSMLRFIKNEMNYECNISDLGMIIQSDFVNQENPFASYFKNLPKWDEKTDYIQQLADEIKTTDREFKNMVFKKWFVAMVGCALVPSEINQTVIVLLGGQGIGKSKFVLSLIPKELKSYLYSGVIKANNNDSLMHLATKFIINLEELTFLRKTDTDSFKHMITLSEVEVRKPYARFSSKQPRRASFIGSVNERFFLTDTTGNRRLLVLDVNSLNYEHKVNIDMVYAQALHLYVHKFQHWFDKKEISDLNERNQEYLVSTPENELLFKYFKQIDKKDAIEFLTTTEIAQEIEKRTGASKTNLNIKILGSILTNTGFHRVTKNSVKKWAVDDVSVIKINRNINTETQTAFQEIIDETFVVNENVRYENEIRKKNGFLIK